MTVWEVGPRIVGRHAPCVSSMLRSRIRFVPQSLKTGDNVLMIRLIRFYQRWISPVLPPSCRFFPTCSDYAAQAIESRGLAKGGALAIRRLCKCHPFHPGGYDPVPITDAAALAGTVLPVETERNRTNTQNPVDQ